MLVKRKLRRHPLSLQSKFKIKANRVIKMMKKMITPKIRDNIKVTFSSSQKQASPSPDNIIAPSFILYI